MGDSGHANSAFWSGPWRAQELELPRSWNPFPFFLCSVSPAVMWFRGRFTFWLVHSRPQLLLAESFNFPGELELRGSPENQPGLSGGALWLNEPHPWALQSHRQLWLWGTAASSMDPKFVLWTPQNPHHFSGPKPSPQNDSRFAF